MDGPLKRLRHEHGAMVTVVERDDVKSAVWMDGKCMQVELLEGALHEWVREGGDLFLA